MYLNKRNSINRLTRFLAGSTSPEEDREIRVLIDSDPGFRNEYEELEKVWKIAGTNSVDYVFDTDKAWANLDARILSQSLQLVKKPSYLFPQSAISGYALKVAAVLLIGLAVFQLAVNRHPYQTIASGNAIITPVSLADGSTIYLNSASSINYPEKFGQDSREVYFWGEAFFEIAHDPSRPFIIETGETRVKVLGTSFNIRAYPETGQVDVIVKSGKVLFYHVDKSDRVLGK
jgi:ferric-dicitrate binding protein FerR (iron transport regulator)